MGGLWFLFPGSLVVITCSTSAHVSVTFSIAAVRATVRTINGHEDKMETFSRGSWKGDRGMRATLSSALLPPATTTVSALKVPEVTHSQGLS